jgi:GT2 family glycosyltransferase
VKASNNIDATYGGRKLVNKFQAKSYKVVPDDKKPISCEYGNANVMLIDKDIVSSIGFFSNHYTHYLGDYDYTLRAVKAKKGVWVAPGYYGICDNDHGKAWVPQQKPLKERIKYLYSVKGLTLKEYMIYNRVHFPIEYPGAYIKLWLKTLFPVLWDKYKI